jgi:2-methylcitrate dehydratase PrpD
MITRILAKYIEDLRFERIPNHVVRETKRHILDTLGVSLAGSRTTVGGLLINYAMKYADKKESTIITCSKKTSCTNAALANAVMAHACNFDDTYEAGVYHPGCSIIPAALAVAERQNASGKDLITSIIAGYDVAVRVAEALSPWHYEGGHNPTGTCNTFGAAASSGKILDLNTDQLTHALGMAGMQAAGLMQQVIEGVASDNCMYAGKSSQNGVFASLLAQMDYKVSPTIIEGEKGFCKVMSSNCDQSKLTEGLGDSFKILETTVKPYPCCRFTHGPIEAILRLVRKHKLKSENVKRIRLRTFDFFSGCDRPDYMKDASDYKMKNSYQYTLAVALLEGKVSLEDFELKKIKDERINELAQKIEVVVEPELTKLYPKKWPYVVEVRTTDGEEYRHRIEFPPSLADDQVTKKFRNLASMVLSNHETDELIRVVTQLERCNNIRQLTELLVS